MNKYIFPGTELELGNLIALANNEAHKHKDCADFLAKIFVSKESFDKYIYENKVETERLEEEDFIHEEDMDEEERIAMYYFLLDLMNEEKTNDSLRNKH